MTIDVKMLPRTQVDAPSFLDLKFSEYSDTWVVDPCGTWRWLTPAVRIEDGKEMHLDLQKLKIKEIQEEVNRHSRALRRQEDLSGN